MVEIDELEHHNTGQPRFIPQTLGDNDQRMKELNWVELDEWPFEDSAEGVAKAHKLAPDNSQWVRLYGDNPGFMLIGGL